MATDCKAEPLSKSVVKYSIDLNCDPCSYGNIIVKATHFCRTCEDPEPLCENCSTQHIRQKMSRHHQICENIREFPKEHMKTDENCNLKELTCVPCSFENVHVKAAYFCHTCKDPEPLCETCSTQHTRQKLTRGHEICKDIWKYFKLHAILGENNQHEKEVECDPCFIENIHVKATHFCKTCVDPEPLCDECAKQHTRQKTCRDHELCKDVEEFLKFQSKNGVDSHKEVYIECDPCLNDGTKVTASHFCKTCVDPEPLCETCAKQHTRQKAFRDHEVSGNINKFPVHHLNKSGGFQQLEDILCDPCLNDDKKVTATHFCKTCVDPEPLCEPCAKQHTRQKAFREHEASRSIHEFQKHCSKKSVDSHKVVYIECDPCSNEGTKVKATHICKTCEDPEPLCETCAKQHTRQKAFRDHELSGIICEIPKHPSNKGVYLEQEEDLACEPCLNGDKKVKATDFCKTCKDPEPLCAYCAKQHTRQKAFKEHKLSGHIHEFPKHPSNKSINKVEKTGLFCNSCLDTNLQVKATQFCKTCNHPELLCETCAKQHLRQKSFRQHEMCGDIKSFSAHPKNTRNTAENLETFEDMYPGKPKATDIKSDAICLFWDKSVKQADQYQIRFKNKDGNMKWKITETDSDENNIMITGLMANENYIFQVRGIYGDQEGPYGAVSEDIYTKKSLATTLLEFSVLQRNTDCPRIYILPVEENKSARSTTARFRMFTLGKPTPYVCDEKTILLVGLKGAGKSTLVDGIVNYILGVSFDDPFRFSVFTLEENAEKAHYKASSKTEWITVYKIYPAEGSRLSYTLSIIDTPGFGDTTKGIEGDNDIVDQTRHLFFAQGDQGDMFIDAVCFIVKAPDAHLTVVQKNIFSLILSLFGKNIESNICTLITFADGTKPPVLASLNESKLPFGLTFNFNNSALFAGNKGVTHDTLSPMFWEMCSSSFERFFRHIKQLETRSFCQTKSVLDEREQLKTVISNIRPQISAGLSKLSELQQQLDISKRYKNEMKDNQNFEYEVDEIKQEKIDLPKGQHVTNCIQCNVTCHEDCRIVDDDEKRGCWAIDKRTGCCRICSGKCIWSDHKNTPYIFKFVTKTVKKTYAEMKQRYEAAQGQTLTHEKYIEKLTYDVNELFDLITAMMGEMTDCKTRLNEIALRPDPLTAVEHIDLMIQSEEMDKQPGFLNRVQMLKEIKKMALVDQDVNSLGQNIRVTRENIKSVTGKSFQTRIRRKNQGSAFTRGIQYVQTLLNNS